MPLRKIRVTAIAALAVTLFASGVATQTDDETRNARREQVRICRAWLKTMQEHAKVGEFDSALAALDSVAACDANNPDAYYFRGIILSSKGDTAGAVSALEEGIRRAPLSSRLKTFLSRIYLAMDNVDGASELINSVLSIKSRDPEALYLSGRVLLARGDTTQALDSFQQAFEVAIEKAP